MIQGESSNNGLSSETLSLPTGLMKLVPAGAFSMGTDDTSAALAERPAHLIGVRAFYLDQCMVTNAQFMRFSDETNYQTVAERMGEGDTYRDGHWEWVKGANWRHPFGPDSTINERLDHPVVLVTVGDALAYCDWRSHKEKRYFRLPTEAEWEKAARGNDGRIYPWGNEEPDHNGVQRARFNAGEPQSTSPVGAHPEGASPYGILDMAGNAWDWCLDAFAAEYYASAPGRDQGGPISLQPESVFRGGSWIFPREATRSIGRHRNVLFRPSVGIGFRTASPQEKSWAIELRIKARRLTHFLGLMRWKIRGRD